MEPQNAQILNIDLIHQEVYADELSARSSVMATMTSMASETSIAERSLPVDVTKQTRKVPRVGSHLKQQQPQPRRQQLPRRQHQPSQQQSPMSSFRPSFRRGSNCKKPRPSQPTTKRSDPKLGKEAMLKTFRALRAYSQYQRQKLELHERAARFEFRSLQKRALDCLKRARAIPRKAVLWGFFISAIQIECERSDELVEEASRSRYSRMLRAWLKAARKQRLLRYLEKRMQEKRKRRLLFRWARAYEQNRLLARHFLHRELVVKSRVLNSLIDFTETEKEEQQLHSLAIRIQEKRRLKSLFGAWKMGAKLANASDLRLLILRKAIRGFKMMIRVKAVRQDQIIAYCTNKRAYANVHRAFTSLKRLRESKLAVRFNNAHLALKVLKGLKLIARYYQKRKEKEGLICDYFEKKKRQRTLPVVFELFRLNALAMKKNKRRDELHQQKLKWFLEVHKAQKVKAKAFRSLLLERIVGQFKLRNKLKALTIGFFLLRAEVNSQQKAAAAKLEHKLAQKRRQRIQKETFTKLFVNLCKEKMLRQSRAMAEQMHQARVQLIKEQVFQAILFASMEIE